VPSGTTGAASAPANTIGELEDRFRLLIEQVTEYAIFLLDPTGHVATWNAGAQRIKGYEADEIVGRHFSAFYRREDFWKCGHELETARQSGRVEDEGWRVRKDGTLFWANVVITCLRDARGEIVGFAKVTRDMTERRNVEESLRTSEERFRLLVESVRDYAIFMLDPSGRVATWNVGAERINGYRAEEIIGLHFSRFYPEEDVLAGKCELELEVAAREGRFEDEGWRIRNGGTRFWANVVISALRGRTGELVGFAKITRDLTERRRAEAERSRLGEDARRRIHELADLSEALAAALSIEDVGRTVIEQGAVLARADTATLFLVSASGAALDLVAERGGSRAFVDQVQNVMRDSGDPLFAVGTGTGDAVWVETEVALETHFPALAGAEDDAKTRAFWCVPLVAEGRTIGLLAMGFFEARSFSPEEREFVGTFARQCAQSLARARRLEAERSAAQTSERLRASLATMVRSIGDAVIATDARGGVVLMNGVAESLTGWGESEARGRPLGDVFDIVNEDTRVRVGSPVDKILETGGIVGLASHTVLVGRHGRETPIDDSGAPIRSQDGAIEGVVLVFRDVTERKREQERQEFLADAVTVLSESLDYGETVARVARLVVPRLADWCAVDLKVDGHRMPKRLAVAHVDPAKIELARQIDAKYPPSPDAPAGVPQVLRSGRPELYPEISEEAVIAACVDAEHASMARELCIRSGMFVPLTARGHVLGVMSFVHAESGRTFTRRDLDFAEEIGRRCANAIENARLYASEQEARRTADVANRAKDEFLAVVSHELRTPLNAIMGWAKMLSAREFDAHRRQSAIETIERNANAMAQLIEDLLDMSRVVSGKLRLEVQHVELARVVAGAIESIQPAAAAKAVAIVPILDTTIAPIMGDPTRLQQVIWNLLSNAVKFTPRGGRVNVLLRRSNSSLEVVVKDTGKGILPSFLPYVFDPFRQEDASPSRTRGGLGLGLAITRQLVELHGGRIGVQSEGEGKGATFFVTLPISAVASPSDVSGARSLAARNETSLDSPAHLRGLRVLVVDDDDDSRVLITGVLDQCGCNVIAAPDVATAMQRMVDAPPDVLLSDIGMPEQDGYDLIRKVRSLPRENGGDIPAAALTAYVRPEDRLRMLNSGYSIHLPKPIEPAELVAVVATLSRFLHRRGSASE
jgi:PAS domain S-box-containing protein